jgi:HK97 family phage major capsid protein
METLNKSELKRKPATELWAMRKRVVAELETRAQATEGREPTTEEKALDERGQANLRAIDSVMEESFRELAMNEAVSAYGLNRPHLTQRDMAAVDWFKSAVTEKNRAPFDIRPEEERAFTLSQPGLEYRDTTKATAAQALPVSVWPSFMVHLVEQTPVMRAGAMVITTATGEDLLYPKTTAFQTANLITEGNSITESDPTLNFTTLRSWKYAAFWQLSKELVEDHASNIIDALSQSAATALALSYGNHLANGTGGGSQPLGYAVPGTVGVTGPTGTSTSFGTQGTAGQGTDLVFDLYASVAEPYLLSPSVAILGRNATFTMFKKYKEATTNRPMLDMTPVKAGSSVNLLGQPGYVDPHAPAMAANAKSVAFGDWSRYVVRIVQGVRVERSDEFAFQNDLASFKAIIRLDGALVDANAIKLFQHSAT